MTNEDSEIEALANEEQVNSESLEDIDNLRHDFEQAIQHDEEHVKNIGVKQTDNTNKERKDDISYSQLKSHKEVPNEICDDLISLEITSHNSDNVKEDLDKNSLQQRYEMVERFFSDVRSVRSVTTASTIAPDVIKDKVRKALDQKQKRDDKKRCVVKGEASAVTRSRRENRDTIKDSTGIWGWE